MSDTNDDLLNYEVGDIDDHFLVDEDELLLSDDETTPTKLSQHEEALLLGDEDLLNEATDKKTNAKPVVKVSTAVSTDCSAENKDVIMKCAEDAPTVSTEVTASTTASIADATPEESVTKPAEPKITDVLNTEKLSQPLPSRRNVLKRNALAVTTVASAVITPLLATPNIVEPAESSKKLRVEAASFVPATRHEVSDLKPTRPPLLELPKPRVPPTAVASVVSAESDEFYAASCSQNSESDYISSIAGDSDVSVVAGNSGLDIGDDSESIQLTQESLTDDTATACSEVESEMEGNQPKNALLELETEDSDEGSERLNPKTRVERDTAADGFHGRGPPQQQPLLRNKHDGGRGGYMGGPRHFQPHPYHPYAQHSGNENFNPQFQPQHLFRPQMDRSLNPLMQGGPHQNGPPGPPMHNMPPIMQQQFRGPPPHQQPPHNFRLPYANDMNRPLLGRPPGGMHPRHLGPPRPDYVPNAIPPFRPFTGNPSLRPVGPPSRFEQQHRPRMPPNQQPQPQQFMPPRLPLLQQYPGGPPGMPPLPAGLQMQQQQHPGSSHVQTNINTNVPPGPPIMPRKVLINPNFKGGVEAATNQLMMDTLNNPQYVSANNDAELLRQQEAFINQNRMQIEKRRHERSPERERNYSPPRRERRVYSRERDIRKPATYAYGRGGSGTVAGGVDRGRRAGSREPPFSYTKRRRSNSGDRMMGRGTPADNRKDKKEPEDEETRAYRLEIEKQKSMREKVLKDKEMRRRKAAEGKTGEEKKADADVVTAGGSAAAPTAKLTPIIVTEKKIISLKKQQAAQAQANGPGAQPPLAARSAAKALPETKKSHVATDTTSAHTAIVRPTIKPPPLTIPSSAASLDEYDEDELLADSPSPSPTSSEPTTATRFTNRRVVLKSSSGITTSVQNQLNPSHVLNAAGIESDYGSSTASHKSKGIFGRLDRKMNTVTDAAKRKIQRIIVQKDYSD